MDNIKAFEPLFGDWSIDGSISKAEGRSCWRASRTVNGEKEYCSIWHIPVPAERERVEKMQKEGMTDEALAAYTEERMRAVNRELAIAERFRGHVRMLNYLENDIRPWEDGKGCDLFIRTELCESLERRAERKPVSKSEAAAMARDISIALSAVETQGIVHRGVSPESIFITANGFKLGGWSSARVRGTDEETVDPAQRTYMAPEGFKGEPLTPASDVYSLGLILYRIMNRGRLPFEPAAPAQVTQKQFENAMLRRIAGAALPAPVGADPNEAETILAICEYEPEKRPKAGEIAEAFIGADKPLRSGAPVPAEPLPSADKKMPEKPAKEAAEKGAPKKKAEKKPAQGSEGEPAKKSKGLKAAIIVFAVIAALAVLGIVGMLVIKPAIDSYNAEKEANAFKPHAPDINQDAVDTDIYHVTIYAENGSAVVYESPDGRRREYQVYEDNRLDFDLKGSDFIPDEPLDSTAYSVQPKFYTRDKEGELVPVSDMGYIMLEIPAITVTLECEDVIDSDDGHVKIKGVSDMPEAELAVNGAKVKVGSDGAFVYETNFPDSGEYELEFEAKRPRYCSFRKTVKVKVNIPEPSVIQMPWELGDNTYSQRVADPGDTVNVRGMVPPGAMLTASCENEEVVINEINMYDDGSFNFGVTLPAIGDYELELSCTDATGTVAVRKIHVQRAPEWRGYVEGSWAMSYEALTRQSNQAYNIKGKVTKIIEHLDRCLVELTTSDGNTLLLEYHHHYPTANPFELGKEYSRIYGYPEGRNAEGAPVVYVWFVIG